MNHGGDVYGKNIIYDFSVSLNPFPPSDEIIQAGIRGLHESGRYPDIMQRSIRKTISEKEGVSESCTLAGNGASELLLGIVRYIKPESALLMEPCYSGYRYVLDSQKGCRIISYKLKEESGFIPTLDDIDNMWHEKPELIILTDPWNPSGKNIPDDFLEVFLEMADREDTWVIIDESFLLLSEKALEERSLTKKELLRRFPKTIVVTSFTKFLSLPGIRMGYMVAQSEVIDGVKHCLPEWNLSIPAEYIMEVGISKAGDREYLKSVITRIREERECLTGELRQLGFKVFDSDSCYIYFAKKKGLGKKLIDEGILIRDYNDTGYYRIGMKTHTDNQYLIQKLTEVVSGGLETN